MARLLGIDPGKKRIGVALSDPEGRIASPHGVIEVTGDEVAEILRLARQNDVSEIVVGYPLRLDGGIGPAAQSAADLARMLERSSALAVTLWDERLSSAQAERDLIAGGVRRRDRRGATDRVAAALILQSYLDSRRLP